MKKAVVPTLVVAALVAFAATIVDIRSLGRLQVGFKEGAVQAAAAPNEPARVAADGRVVTYPGGDVVLGAEKPGLIVELSVIEGDAVQQGDVVAKLDTSELEAQIAETEAGIREAEADLKLARLTLNRRSDLVARNVASVAELDEAARDVEALEARKAALSAQSIRLTTALKKHNVVTPISGTVVVRHADPGEVLEAGDPVLTIADLTRLRVEGEADESDAGRISIGDPVTITADGYPGVSWKGTVEEVPGWVEARRLKPEDPSRLSDTRILAVKVAFEELTPLKLGTTVQMVIEAQGDSPAPTNQPTNQLTPSGVSVSLTAETHSMDDYAPHPSVVCTVLDNGGVLLHLDTKYYYSLNATGMLVWSLLESGAKNLEKEIARRFPNEPARDEALEVFLGEMEREQLLCPANGDPTGSDVPENGTHRPSGAQPGVDSGPACPVIETSAEWSPPRLIRHDVPLNQILSNPFDPSVPLAE